jgi:hypothetical protein
MAPAAGGGGSTTPGGVTAGDVAAAALSAPPDCDQVGVRKTAVAVSPGTMCSSMLSGVYALEKRLTMCAPESSGTTSGLMLAVPWVFPSMRTRAIPPTN